MLPNANAQSHRRAAPRPCSRQIVKKATFTFVGLRELANFGPSPPGGITNAEPGYTHAGWISEWRMLSGRERGFLSQSALAVSVKDDKTLNLRQQILLYFKPKKFEFYRGRTIYELIGIKIYKKYLPTTGDLVRQRRKITQIKISKSNKIDELYKYERKTRSYEWRHIIGAIIFILLIIIFDGKLTVFDWIFLSFLNLYINIYPIFLQRYNRIRIIQVLQNNRQPSPY